MTSNASSLEVKLYQVLTKKITLKQFEKWLYDNDTLESDNPDLYFDLICFDYSNQANFSKFQVSFEKYIDRYKFEIGRIKDYLYSIIERDEHCADAILMTYELYCMGYEFFQKLGLMYGLCLIDSSYPVKLIFNASEVIDLFYPDIIEDTKNALAWLEEGQIIFKEKKGDYGAFEYDDLRTEEEQIKGQVVTTSFND